jgi:hypothetical protein
LFVMGVRLVQFSLPNQGGCKADMRLRGIGIQTPSRSLGEAW